MDFEVVDFNGAERYYHGSGAREWTDLNEIVTEMPLYLQGRAQAFSWLHDAAWMGGWWRYRAADRCGGCGCDLADVLGGLVLMVNRGCVTGHAGKWQARR